MSPKQGSRSAQSSEATSSRGANTTVPNTPVAQRPRFPQGIKLAYVSFNERFQVNNHFTVSHGGLFEKDYDMFYCQAEGVIKLRPNKAQPGKELPPWVAVPLARVNCFIDAAQ